MFVFVFYVALNDDVKNFWLRKCGFMPRADRASRLGPLSVSNTNVCADASASNQETEHIYSTAVEFLAKKDDNANL